LLLAQDSSASEGRIIREIRLNIKPAPSMPPGIEITKKDRDSVRDTLRSMMKSIVGKPYSARILDGDIKRITKQGRFWPNIKVVRIADGVRLDIEITLRPVVKEILFKDAGGNKISVSSELLLEIVTEKGSHFSKYFLLHDSKAIEKFYRGRSYPFVKAKGGAKYSAKGVTVRFVIEQGSYVVVRSIEFEGNKFFTSEKLYRKIQTRVQTFMRNTFLGPDAKYIRGTVDEDVKTLLDLYRSEGYLDAVVKLKSVRFNKEKDGAFITFAIEEGRRYYVESVSIKGNVVFSTGLLSKKLSIKPGDPYRKQILDKDTDAIAEIYERAAYIYRRVEPKISYGLKGDKVKLTFNIHEGPQIHLRKLRIEGNYRTRNKVIRRQISVYPGEKFDAREWRDSLQRIINLRFFQDLQTMVEETEEPHLKDLVIRVVERKTGQMQFGFSYSTAVGLQGLFQLSQPNFDITDMPKSLNDFFSGNAFSGSGTVLSLKFQPGRTQTSYSASYKDPYFMDTDTRLSLGLDYTDSEYLRWDQRREGFRFGLGRNLSRKLSFDVIYRLEANTLTNISPSSPIDVFLSEGTKNLSALKPVITLDKSNIDIHGTRYSGFNAQASYEYGGGFMGGEVDFSAAFLSFGAYQKVFEDDNGFKHVLSLELSGNWKEPHHNTDIIPWYERYKLGGPGTLRGFEWWGAGPKEGRDFVGGNVRATGSLEYSMPIPVSKELLRLVIFLDTGNLAKDVDSFLLKEFRLSTGFGLRIRAGNSFVFVMDFGYPLKRFKGDERRTFHFSFGTEF
jgi:outer membrane protein insertion porin family